MNLKKFGEWLDNFWYHYKGVVIACLIGAAIIGTYIYTRVVQVNADVQVIISVDKVVRSEDMDSFYDQFQKYCKDYNGDGLNDVGIAVINTSEDQSKEVYSASVQRLIAQISEGETYVLFLNDRMVDYFRQQDGLEPIANVLPGYSGQSEDCIPLSELPNLISDNSFLKALADDGVKIGFRRYSGTSYENKHAKAIAHSKEFLDNLVNNRQTPSSSQ